jgi:HEPN domain-containing protein
MPRRHEDWLAQAERDLEAARGSLATGHYEWCAFQAQQSAEKAIKALLFYFNREERIHSLVHLLREAKAFVRVPRELTKIAQELDRHYIQSRYPNGFPEGHPAEYYDLDLAKRCISYAEKFLHFVKQTIR